MLPSPSIRRNVPLLYLFNFFAEFRLYAPIAIIFFSEVAGSYALGMTVFSVIMLTQTIGEVPLGVLSDYIGRKKTMLAGATCGVGAVVLYASGLGYSYLLLGAILEGLSRTFFSGNNEALLYETLQELGEDTRYADVSGKTSAMLQLALAASALAGSLVAAYYSLALLFWLTVIPQIVTLVASVFLVEPRRHTAHIAHSPFRHTREAVVACYRNKDLRLLTLSNAISRGVGEALHQFKPVFVALLWPAWAVGIYRALTNAGGFVGFYFSGYIIKTFSAVRSLLVLSGISNGIQIVSLLIANLFSPLIMALPSVTFGTERTATETLQQANFTSHQRATMGSLSALLASLLAAIMAIFFGWFADSYGVINALLTGHGVLLFGVYLNYRLFRNSAEVTTPEILKDT